MEKSSESAQLEKRGEGGSDCHSLPSKNQIDEAEKLCALKSSSSVVDVHKDECMVSFTSAESKGGLYTNLITYHSWSEEYVGVDFNTSHCPVYLHTTARRVYRHESVEDHKGEGQETTPSKMGIGVTQGFHPNVCSYDLEYTRALSFFTPQPHASPQPLPRWPLTPDGASNTDTPLPQWINERVMKVLEYKGGVSEEFVPWEEDPPQLFKGEIPQVSSPPSVPPAGWRCAVCGATTNLWLNLSDGYIGCGRKQFVKGLGGCHNWTQEGAAVVHYEENKSYRLGVKLGTITSDSADVFDYGSDASVIDGDIKQHLSHFGINMEHLRKVEKSMIEIQIELNKDMKWSAVTECDKQLERQRGPGFVGLKNLGSTCYINSVIQAVTSLSGWRERFTADLCEEVAAHAAMGITSSGSSPSLDLLTQLCKVTKGLSSSWCSNNRLYINSLSDEYFKKSKDAHRPEDEEYDILTPKMFRSLIGIRHTQFAANRQQDADEFLHYLVDGIFEVDKQLANLKPTEGKDVSAASLGRMIQFQVESRFQEHQTNKVRYTVEARTVLDLPLTLASTATTALPSDDTDDIHNSETHNCKRVKTDGEGDSAAVAASDNQTFSFERCIAEWSMVDKFSYVSPTTKEMGVASRQYRFKTFPRYLFITAKRFHVSADWSITKLTNQIDMPLEMNLEKYRGTGLKQDEVVMDEANETQRETTVGVSRCGECSDEVKSELKGMGFGDNAIRRAEIGLSGTSLDTQSCVNWLFDQTGDVDAPLRDEEVNNNSKKVDGCGVDVSPESIEVLTGMGFTVDQATASLISNNNDVNSACDWLYSRLDDSISLEETVKDVIQNNKNRKEGGDDTLPFDDGKGEYSLVAMISHLGPSTHCGHYVAHVLKNGRWTLFNDEYVALSEDPPFKHAYIYVYQRTSSIGTARE